MTEFHITAQGRRLAYRRHDAMPDGAVAAMAGTGGVTGEGAVQGLGGVPGLVFIHGFRSDMNGTKALDLEQRARRTGRAMLRFDLSGHGESGGDVADWGIGDWLEDATDIIDALAPGPQVLVGSSLGGWLALLLARARPERFAGLVTIAAAPDFTTRMQADFSEADHRALAGQGRITRPSDYAEGDYIFSRRLFDQGAQNRVFDQPLTLPMSARFLQGTADEAVPIDDALALIGHAQGPDIRLVLVKDGDHRFSSPEQLDLIWLSVVEVG